MGIIELMRGLLKQTHKIEKTKLPSQGIFYLNDFEIKIKKADMEDIIEYELNYDKENLYSIIESVKTVVKKNVILTNDYKFEDIKSVDIVFIFLEIVKFTMNKELTIPYFDDSTGNLQSIKFDYDNFNYFDFSKYEKDEQKGEILINDYRFSMPSIGIENCLTQFLITKSSESDSNKWNSYNYDFLFFCGNKNNLTFSEIENLVTIFNYDITPEEQDKISNIVSKFLKVIGYKLKTNGRVVDVKSKIDLENIWKD